MLTSTTRKIIYDIRGIAVPIETGYEIPFRIFSAENVNVSLALSDGSNPVLDSGWSVQIPSSKTGVAKVIFDEEYTFPENAEKLVISRYVDPLQNTDLRNGDEFDAEILEEVFDQQTAMIQQLSEALSRSFKLPISENPDDVVFPGAAARAGKVIGFGEDGTTVITYPNTKEAMEASEEAKKALLQIIEINKTVEENKNESEQLLQQIKNTVHPGYRVTIGDGTTKEFFIKHNLHSEWVQAFCWYKDVSKAGYYVFDEVDMDTLKVTFRTPPETDSVEVRIIPSQRVEILELADDMQVKATNLQDVALTTEEVAEIIEKAASTASDETP